MWSIIPKSTKHTAIKPRWSFLPRVSCEDTPKTDVSDPMLKSSLLNFTFHNVCVLPVVLRLHIQEVLPS